VTLFCRACEHGHANILAISEEHCDGQPALRIPFNHSGGTGGVWRACGRRCRGHSGRQRCLDHEYGSGGELEEPDPRYNVYFEHVNRNGGVRGRKIRLVNKDDGVKPEAMVEHAKALIADKEIVALVGFLNTLGIGEIIKQEMLVKGNIAMIAHVGAQDAPNFYPVRASYADEMRKILEEIKASQRKRVALVYVNQAFGPPIFKLAMETAPKLGIDIVATGVFESAPEKLRSGIESVSAEVAKARPDAIFLMAGGMGAHGFVKRFKEVYPDFVQFYALSPADHSGFVKVAGLQNAQGVIISQCVPHPRNNSLAIVREYQKMMKEYAPKEQLSFYSLEGFMGARSRPRR